MYFLAPLYLAGLAAAAIPIVLHMYSNRQAKTVDFSSLRLIRLSLETKARWLWLQDAILLALRVLIFALLPLALAKPALKTIGGKAPLLSRPTTSAVIVIDNSFSMGASSEGATAFERAKDGARKLVRTFRPGDEVALYLVNSALDPVFPSFTLDLDRVGESIESLPLSNHTTRFSGVLAKCLDLLSDAKTANKEIYVFSDFQASGWDLAKEPALTVPKEVASYLIDCGRDGVGNVAVTSLRVEPGPKVVNRVIRLEADMQNFGDATETIAMLFVRQLGAQAKPDTGAEEKPKAQRQLKLEAHKTEAVGFEYTFPQIGRYEVRVQLQPDSLPADDARWLVLPISEQERVLAVGGEKGLGVLSDTFYLSLALRPQTSADPKKWAGITVTSARQSAMLDRPLSTYDTVFLCNVPGFSDAQVQALEDYVALGGSLVVFLGDGVNIDNYVAKLAGGAGRPGLLPAKILSPLKSPQRTQGRAFSLSEVDEKHPIFAGLSDRAHQAVFALKFSRYAALDTVAALAERGSGGKTSVLAKLEDGTPMILEKELGRGRVIFFNTAADRGYGSRAGADMGWSNLVTSPIFPVLMHRTLDYLTSPREMARDLLVGESVPFLFPLEAAKTVEPLRILRPDGASDAIIPRPEAGFLRASYIVDGPPGVYRAERDKAKEAKSSDAAKPMFFVANRDTSESNLARVAAKDVGDKLSGGSVVLINGVEELVAKVTRAREGFRLWPMVIAFLMVLLALESFISNRMVYNPKKQKRRRLAPAAVTAALVGAILAAVAIASADEKLAPKNLIPNGDFETGADKMPAKWDHPAQWKSTHKGLVTTESRQGDARGGKCLHFHVPKAVGENEGLQIFSDFFSVPDGGDIGGVYRFRLDAKKVGTGMITWVSFFTDDKRAPVYRAQFRPDCGEDWKTCERIFKVHVRSGQTKLHPEQKLKWIQVELMCVYAGGDGWFDNLSLELLPSDTPVAEPAHPDPEPLLPGGKKLK